MAEITFLNGLSEDEVELRRRKRFLQLSPTEKINAFFALCELSIMTSAHQNRPKARLTISKKNGHSK